MWNFVDVLMQWLANHAVALLFPIYMAGTCCVLIVVVRMNRTSKRLGGLEQEVRSARTEIESLLKVVDEQANIIAKLGAGSSEHVARGQAAGQQPARHEIEGILSELTATDNNTP